MAQHITDEVLLNRLLHRVAVEWQVAHGSIWLGIGKPEDLQGLVLGGGGEGEVAGVWQQLLGLHQPVDLVFRGFLGFLCSGTGEGEGDGRRGASALAGMGFIDQDCKVAAALLIADRIKNEGKLLHRRDDDLFAFGDELA